MPKRAQEQYENDDGFVEDAPQSKKAKSAGANEGKKATTNTQIQIDDEGNEYWEGISLSVDQYTALLSVLPRLENLLHGRGIEVPRPQYDGPAATNMLPEEEAEEAEEVAEEEQDVKPSKRKLDKKFIKANHETTSDEDEG
ncbi:hypothetical protein LTR74_009892 [Friedmanniomyces endolithicus]|nr:hypothetical protein LTR74_009892 [Friedmanniomyces endolithicus]